MDDNPREAVVVVVVAAVVVAAAAVVVVGAQKHRKWWSKNNYCYTSSLPYDRYCMSSRIVYLRNGSPFFDYSLPRFRKIIGTF